MPRSHLRENPSAYVFEPLTCQASAVALCHLVFLSRQMVPRVLGLSVPSAIAVRFECHVAIASDYLGGRPK